MVSSGFRLLLIIFCILTGSKMVYSQNLSVEGTVVSMADSNPLANFGTDYEMLIIPIHLFTAGQQVDQRGQMEEALTSALEAHQAGKVLGGATGLDNAYIDLVLFDGSRSRHLIKTVMAASPYAEHYRHASFLAASNGA